jgi:hypothetical protein
MQYNQPFDQPSNPNASYVNGNPSSGTPGSIPPAATFEYPQREIVNLITDAGIAPTNADLHQVSKSIQGGTLNYAPDTGAANAMVAAFTPIIASLRPGLVVRVKKINAPNAAGGVTIDVGTGANAIVRSDGSTPIAGDLPANGIVELVWTGSNWQTVNFQGVGGTGTNVTNINVSIPYAADTGTANALVATFSPALTSLPAGQMVLVKVANTNTGSATIVANGLPNKTIVHRDLTVLNANDLIAGSVVTLNYDGTYFQLVGRTITPGIACYSAPGSYSWTCPAGVYTIYVKVTGAGGGGGCCYTSDQLTGGCGGGGGVSEGLYSVVPGTSYNVLVGAGGPGSAGLGTGNYGGTSSFALGPTATGGGPGLGHGQPTLRGGISGYGYGGNIANYGLGDGDTGSQLYLGNTNLIGCGKGGGPGGQSGAGSGNVGYPGRGPGGGGGGSSDAEQNSVAGSGYAGEVRIEYLYT